MQALESMVCTGVVSVAADVVLVSSAGALEHAARASADTALIAPMRKEFFMGDVLNSAVCSTPDLCVGPMLRVKCLALAGPGIHSATKRLQPLLFDQSRGVFD